MHLLKAKHQDVAMKEVKVHLHKVFMYTAFPMVVLYRFHATVCLSVSFTSIFQDEVTRFATMLTTMKPQFAFYNQKPSPTTTQTDSKCNGFLFS